jgi:hypothetical protein
MEERLNTLMLELEGKDKIYSHQTDEMFNLYNEIFPDIKEFGKSCASCRERVYKTLKDHWLKTKNK